MEQYRVTGMSCAACSSRVEKAVSNVPGVTSCSVSLLTNSMGVEGTASASEIIAAVEAAGYGASLKNAETGNGGAASAAAADEMLKDTETPKMKKRLIASLIFLIPLMYVSMGHMMWGWPLPSFMAENHIAMGLTQLLLTTIVMVINQKFFVNGFKGLIHLAPNMDTLVALGAGASYGYSVYALYAMTAAQVSGDMDGVMSFMHEFYFESAAMILTLITVGKMLEARSKGKTTDALKSLMKLAPKTATVIRNGEELNVSIEQVKKGDVFVVRPGENIPVDGIVIEGTSAVNEAALTGESIPVDKKRGDAVSAATLNQSGFIRCEATRVGEDTTLSQIIQMVSDAAATKAPIAKVADRVSGVFVPTVITIAVITMVVWLLAGQSIGFALARGISVLVISCPCALGLATPTALMVGMGKGAEHHILIKDAFALENLCKVDTVVLDKTGTLTEGVPEVTDSFWISEASRDMLDILYTAEMKSEHPLASAILSWLKGTEAAEIDADSFESVTGRGIQMQVHGVTYWVGSKGFLETFKAMVPPEAGREIIRWEEDGKSIVYYGWEAELLAVMAISDRLKPTSGEAVEALKEMGIEVHLLTGDGKRTAETVAAMLDIRHYKADVLPSDKEEYIRSLQAAGRKVAMVGDGINDSQALARADVSIAMGKGTDIAMDVAMVTLITSDLMLLPDAIRLSKRTVRSIHQNLFWAFIYNLIGIPLAAGVLFPVNGLLLNPMLASAAMAFSSVSVVLNSLRLKWSKL